MDALLQFLFDLAEKHPAVAVAFGVVGFLRVVNKPFFSFVRAVVGATATKKDDEFLDKVEASKIYKGFAYVLDWFGSVKIGPQADPNQAK